MKEGALPQRLAESLTELISDEELQFGDRLPTERATAQALAVGRSTVTQAFARLKSEGWLDSKQGRGWQVSRRRLDHTAQPGNTNAALDGRLVTFGDRHNGIIDLSSGALGGLPLVADAVSNLPRHLVEEHLQGDGYDPQGLPSLRVAIANYYGDLGCPTDPECILVTHGSQQAVELIARTWLEHGDVVVTEDPSYRGALEAFKRQGARVIAVPVHSDGLDVDALERLILHRQPRLVYLLPTAHNPTGFTMSAAKRRAVRDIMQAHDSTIIEDGSPADLLLDTSGPPAPLVSQIEASTAIAIGSLSKLFWGGLRVGWIRAPRAVIGRLIREKTTVDLSCSPITQLVALELMTRVDEARTIRFEQLTHSLTAFEEFLATESPEWTWQRPSGGSGLWVRLPQVDTVALTQAARQHGVSVMAGPAFSAVEGFREMIRLPFTKPLDEAREGVRRLHRAWEELQ